MPINFGQLFAIVAKRSVDKIIGCLESLPDRMLMSSSSANLLIASDNPGQAVFSAFDLSLRTFVRRHTEQIVTLEAIESKKRTVDGLNDQLHRSSAQTCGFLAASYVQTVVSCS